ncbi:MULTISPECIES: DUF4124 domain-containing protein [Psychrobacter]|uniref:DUF4124 domain-containing protein n=1 Tax=Psychrobacter halodurans TaxID=2818439 RepID=A0AAW4IV43_9GAMM|nr:MULTISPECIES: DUF4124 domain-containing protein [Psychrobacter]MBO1516480.1 DUF4124 domain-containing protein [Psychrobacter halodurans]PJX23530.1 DUF4124 domain-containing protein [Psychrobacter sp. L7]
MTTFILTHIKNTHIKDADVTTIALKSSTLKTRGIKAKCFGLLTALTVLSVSITVPIVVPTSHAAPIYKVVDEKTGQVTFTDRPQNYKQQTDKTVSQTAVSTGRDTIGQVTGEATSSSAPVSTANSTANSTDMARKAVSYQLMIAEPSETRAYRRPAQSIEVRVQVTPALQAGDGVRIYLDGSEVAQGLSASIATVDLMPGAHNIKAVIQNKKGQLLKEAARTVYVLQNTQTLQNNKKIAQQRLAYQNLPWHQKLLLKLRQKDGSLQTVQSAQPKTNDAFTK